MWLTWHSSPCEAGSMFHHFGFGHRLVTTPVNETWWKRCFVTLEAGSQKECSFCLTLHLWDAPPWNQPPSCGETQATRRGSEGPLRTSINRRTRRQKSSCFQSSSLALRPRTAWSRTKPSLHQPLNSRPTGSASMASSWLMSLCSRPQNTPQCLSSA